jgi:ParB-like chromosome segregation protein Spo0J
LLRPNSYNPNRLSPEEFKGLVESIQNAGYCEQNPILARPLDGYFEIVDGKPTGELKSIAKKLEVD